LKIVWDLVLGDRCFWSVAKYFVVIMRTIQFLND
jgi:hypothetical protein